MVEMATEQAELILNDIVRTINERCGKTVLNDFHRNHTQLSILTSKLEIDVDDIVPISMKEMPSCVKHILKTIININNRNIQSMIDTNQKLEELKKELK
jgi:hypothetical protein